MVAKELTAENVFHGGVSQPKPGYFRLNNLNKLLDEAQWSGYDNTAKIPTTTFAAMQYTPIYFRT